MNRRSFRTKNILELHSLVYITMMCFVLLAFFLALGNVGKIIRAANLDSGKADQAVIDSAVTEGTDKVFSEKVKSGTLGFAPYSGRFYGGNGSLKVALWGDQIILDALGSQLMMMDQAYDRMNDLSGLENYDLLVAADGTLAEENVEKITAFVEDGGNVWFTNLTKKFAERKDLQKLMGIQSAAASRRWPGIRISGDIALGNVMENPKYRVKAVDVKLKNKTKLYACALPRDYKELELEELPPLIWRYIAEEDYGGVYVCNGDFMSSEALYFMLPAIFSELQGNYVYGIVNAYCVFAEGFPYAKNEERDSWERFYSRDKMAIAQDLLSSQFLRYYTEYGSKITYFSEDYEAFQDTDDKTLRYYTDIIENSMGLLALKNEEGLFLEDSSERLKIIPWYEGFSFTEYGNYCLPLNFEYTAENSEEDIFNMLGSAVGVGFYSFTNDVDKLLYDHDNRDVWDDYCKYQEVVFGIGVQNCDWLERMTASQALERLYQHLNAHTEVVYGENSIEITTDADSYWMIFKGKATELSVTGGTATEIGNRCWLIEVNDGEASINYR